MVTAVHTGGFFTISLLLLQAHTHTHQYKLVQLSTQWKNLSSLFSFCQKTAVLFLMVASKANYHSQLHKLPTVSTAATAGSHTHQYTQCRSRHSGEASAASTAASTTVDCTDYQQPPFRRYRRRWSHLIRDSLQHESHPSTYIPASDCDTVFEFSRKSHR